MADLRQRLAGRHEARRHTAGGFHLRPPAPETLRSFGRYELTTAYTPAGQLQRQHLNSLQYDRDYTWNDNGELIRISSPRQTRSYSYSTTGRLTGVHTTAANLDIRIPYATDPAEPPARPGAAPGQHPACGRITVSPVTRTIFTGMTVTAG